MSMSEELKTEDASAFGYSADELLKNLYTDEEFAERFMEQFSIVQEIVKKYKNEKKREKEAAQAAVKEEKEAAEKLRLETVIDKMRESFLESVPDDLFEGTTKDIKLFIKEERIKHATHLASVKAEKDAAKQAKLDAKQARLTAKTEKEAAQMEKMCADITKWNESDVLSVILSKCDNFKELKENHTKGKLLIQLKKLGDGIVNLPDYDEETIALQTLQEMHTRCKLIKQMAKFGIEYAYDNEMNNSLLKENLVTAQNAPAPAN